MNTRTIKFFPEPHDAFSHEVLQAIGDGYWSICWVRVGVTRRQIVAALKPLPEIKHRVRRFAAMRRALKAVGLCDAAEGGE